MSEVTTTIQNNPAERQSNPYEDLGRSMQRPIAGQLLKFSKGEYVAGQDNLPVPMGTRFVVNMEQMLHGWIRWDDNKPAEQVMGFIGEGYVLPERNTLGYEDESQWIVDEQSGQSRDPWQETFYLVMRELDSDNKPLEDGLFTFTTSSKGGKDAVKAFGSLYGRWMRLRPDDHPILTLGYDQYEHPISSYGWIKTPQFVMGYTSAEQLRAKKKVKLFDPADNKFWMPKKQFGDIPMTAEMQEAIPF